MFEFLIENKLAVGVAQWGLGLALSGLVANSIKKEFKKFGQGFTLEVNTKINSINDPDLKEMVRHAVRYGAHRFPDASGSQKLDMAIKAVQDATPNWIISDDKIKELLQNAYNDLKGDLDKI